MRSFLLIFSPVYFSIDLTFLMLKSFTSWATFTPRHRHSWNCWEWNWFPDLFINIIAFLYWKATKFCVLIFYLAIVLSVFISCRGFLMESVDYFMYRFISLVSKDTWTPSFSICLFLICLTTVRFQVRYWTEKERNQEWTFCFVSDFSENMFNKVLAMEFLDIIYTKWKYVSCCYWFSGSFYDEVILAFFFRDLSCI